MDPAGAGAGAGSAASMAKRSLDTVLSPSQMSITERLEYRRQSLQEDLAHVEEALAALKANPEVERVMNLVARA